MKKLPLALSTLTLVGSTGLAGGAILQNHSALAQNSPIVTLAASENYWEQDYVFLDPADGLAWKNFYLTEVYPAQSKIEMQFGTLAWDGFAIKRSVFAYFDYENGVTEKMADAMLPQLGVDNTGWIYSDDARSFSANLGTMNSGTLRFNNNLTGLLYYAFQVRRDSDGASFWMRGKVNYRRCTHAKAMDLTNSNFLCRATVTTDPSTRANTVTYKVRQNTQTIEFADDDPDTTWAEEWIEILRGRADGMKTSLELLRDIFLDPEGKLSGAANQLAKLRKNVDNLDEPGDLAQKVENLEAILKQAQEAYASWSGQSDAGQTEAMGQLQADVARLQAENSRLEDENRKLKEQNSLLESQLGQSDEELASENQRLRERLSELESKNQALESELAANRQVWQDKLSELEDKNQAQAAENEGLLQTIQQLEEELRRLGSDQTCTAPTAQTSQDTGSIQNDFSSQDADSSQNNSSIQNDDRVQSNSSAQNEQKVQDATASSGDNAEIEVPVLGSTKPERNLWWLMVVAIVSTGVLGLVIQRKARKLKR